MNKSDKTRDYCMTKGPLSKCGYDWWWHSFTAQDKITGEQQPFFIEYFVCNPSLGGDEPIFGQLKKNIDAGIKPSYLMVKVGWWGNNAGQIHRFFGWNKCKISYDSDIHVIADDCYCSETEMKGSVSLTDEEAKAHPEYMCNGGSMKWDIKIDKKIAFNVGYGANKFFRKLNAFQMVWHAEGMKTLFEGTITLNGREYVVTPEKSFGYQDKNWGKDFTSPWVWLSSNNLTSNITGKKLTDSVFDIGGGKPKIFFLTLNRKLLSEFWYEGKDYEFNFSKLWTLTRTKFDCKETDTEILWYVRQETTTAVMETEIHCLKKDMLLIKYEAPNGKQLHNRLWNGGNGVGNVKLYKKCCGKLVLIDDVKAENIGCEYGEYCEKTKE